MILNDIEYAHPDFLARAVLLAIREGKVTDWDTLAAKFPQYDTSEFSTAGSKLERAVRNLAEAGLICIDDQGKISLTPAWPDIQTLLGISLMELVKEIPGQSMSVTPFFGKPKELADYNYDIFMAMPFVEMLKPIYEDHIKNVVKKTKLDVVRGDDIFTANSVMEDVWSAINGARIVIAECTGRNPNVFYEIGMAHTIGKPIILITQNSNDVPFDLRHIRYIKYDYTPRGMKDFESSLKKTLEHTLKDTE